MLKRLRKLLSPKPARRYFLVTLYIYNNNVLRKVFSDIAETTDGTYPSRAHIRYQAVLTQVQNGFKCTHCEIGSIQELTATDLKEYNHVPEYIREIQIASIEQKERLEKRKAQNK